MGRGTSILVAGLGAALALPLLGLGLKLPIWLAAVIAAGVFAGLWLVLKPGGAGQGFSDEAVLDARSDTARDLLADGAAAAARLQKAARAIKDGPMRTEVDKLTATADRVLKEVRGDPDRAMAVRRLLTFYIPNAASLAEGWLALESRTSPSPQRVDQTRKTMQALSQAFDKFADDVAEPQLQTLDLDLKVLNDALKSDLETVK